MLTACSSKSHNRAAEASDGRLAGASRGITSRLAGGLPRRSAGELSSGRGCQASRDDGPNSSVSLGR